MPILVIKLNVLYNWLLILYLGSEVKPWTSGTSGMGSRGSLMGVLAVIIFTFLGEMADVLKTSSTKIVGQTTLNS